MIFRNILKYTPILTGILIFLGFLNLHYYYKYFDIDIFEYITAGELIVSFFPILINIFVVILFIALPFIIQMLLDVEKLTPEQKEDTENAFKPIKQWELLRERFSKENLKMQKWYLFIPYIITAPIGFLMSIIIYIVTIGGIILVTYDVFNNPQDLYGYQGILIFLFLFSYILFIQKGVNRLEKKFNEYFNLNTSIYMLITQIVIIYIFFNVFSNFASAQKVLGGKPDFTVSFNYKDSSYISDNKFVYIGRTQNYIFFKDTPTDINYIFPSNNVQNLQMKKVQYDNK